MKKHFLIASIFLFLPLASYSQCNNYYDLQEGKLVELETFNAKNKKTGKVINLVKSLTTSPDSFEALVETKTLDEKNKEQTNGEYAITCKNGLVSLDLKALIPQESLRAYESMDMTFSGDFLQIPEVINVGDVLQQGTLICEVRDKSSGKIFSTMNVLVSDRKVKGKETINTPAGTYQCFKISYKMSINTSMLGVNIPIHFSGIDFIAEKEGIVRSESYNKNGKLMAYTLLSKVE